MKHILSVLVENRAGVLYKVSGLFSRRGFNIDSLAVGVTQDPAISRMTIIVDGDDNIVEQVTKQLHKLVDVIKVLDITGKAVGSQLSFIKVKAPSARRHEIIEIASVYQARIIDLSPETMTLELTGDDEKLLAIKALLEEFGILELVQTGALAIEKGPRALRL